MAKKSPAITGVIAGETQPNALPAAQTIKAVNETTTASERIVNPTAMVLR